MNFDQVVERRRMVRNFDDRPLPPHIVEGLLANARRAPSAGFTQGVELLVLEGHDQTSRYWDAALPAGRRDGFRWPGVLNAPLLLVVFAHEQAYVDRYAEPDKARSWDWPAPYWIVDAAFAAMLVLLTAVDRGLGALFFGVFRPDEVRAAFGVPEGYDPIGTIAAGYPLPDEPSRSSLRGRRPSEQVIHRGAW